MKIETSDRLVLCGLFSLALAVFGIVAMAASFGMVAYEVHATGSYLSDGVFLWHKRALFCTLWFVLSGGIGIVILKICGM